LLQFLQPAWLLAGAAILLPILIHLWNVRQGKTLKIGSTLLLSENARQQARSFRVKDLLLLLLRCCIILLLAALLAAPVWRKDLDVKKKTGWVLLDKDHFTKTYHLFQPMVDSLLASGYELHVFGSEFQQLKLQDTVSLTADSNISLPYWTVLKRLNEQVPDSLPLYLFTPRLLQQFSGQRPQLSMNLHWHTYAPADSTAETLVAARLLPADSLLATVAHSNAEKLIYITETLPLHSLPANYQLQTNNGSMLLSATGTNKAVAIDTATLTAVIYTDAYATDARYLQAALQAIRQFGHYRIQAIVTSTIEDIPPSSNWLFWLSQKALPPTIDYKNIFMYEKGKEKIISSSVEKSDGLSAGAAVHLFKHVEGNTVGETVWSDGFGEPLLSKEQRPNGNLYHFYSRFVPAWNGLVWNEAFPQLLFNLMIKASPDIQPQDTRTIEEQQLQPCPADNTTHYGKQLFVETTDLSDALWIVAFLLFLLERGISFFSKQTAYAGKQR
jgi:hypothetical protein